jgi:hypothetical protein
MKETINTDAPGTAFAGTPETGGGVFTDRVIGNWLAETGQDVTANRARPIPEELLHYHNLPEAGMAAGAMVMAGEVVEG